MYWEFVSYYETWNPLGFCEKGQIYFSQETSPAYFSAENVEKISVILDLCSLKKIHGFFRTPRLHSLSSQIDLSLGLRFLQSTYHVYCSQNIYSS